MHFFYLCLIVVEILYLCNKKLWAMDLLFWQLPLQLSHQLELLKAAKLQSNLRDQPEPSHSRHSTKTNDVGRRAQPLVRKFCFLVAYFLIKKLLAFKYCAIKIIHSNACITNPPAWEYKPNLYGRSFNKTRLTQGHFIFSEKWRIITKDKLIQRREWRKKHFFVNERDCFYQTVSQLIEQILISRFICTHNTSYI